MLTHKFLERLTDESLPQNRHLKLISENHDGSITFSYFETIFTLDINLNLNSNNEKDLSHSVYLEQKIRDRINKIQFLSIPDISTEYHINSLIFSEMIVGLSEQFPQFNGNFIFSTEDSLQIYPFDINLVEFNIALRALLD